MSCAEKFELSHCKSDKWTLDFHFLVGAWLKALSLYFKMILKRNIILDRRPPHAPYIRSNAHYYFFWPRTIRDLRPWVHIFTYFITFTIFTFQYCWISYNPFITFNLCIEYILNILLNLLRPWTRSCVLLAGKFSYTYTNII